MKHVKHFSPLTSTQLMETSGGGLAYDVGRIIRFLGISAGQFVGTANAVVDWQINALVNEIENG